VGFRFPKGLALLGEKHLNTAKPVMMIFAFGRKAFKHGEASHDDFRFWAKSI
jgi:hypothetical protein